MSEFKQIVGIDNQPYYSFFHNKKEYFVWIWLNDGGPEVAKACLSTPTLSSSGAYTPNNLLTASASKSKVDAAGGTKAFMRDIFIPKVNEYLAAQGGGGTSIFPEDKGNMEQFNWLVENAISYKDGIVKLSL